MRVAIRVALIAFMPLATCAIVVSTAVAALIPFDYTWEADISWSVTWTENDVPFSTAGTVHRTGLGEGVFNTEAQLNPPDGPNIHHTFRAGGVRWDIESFSTDPTPKLFDGFRPPVPDEWVLSVDPFNTSGPADGSSGSAVWRG